MSGNKDIPKIIKEVGFDFDWSEAKVWALDMPVEEIDISELAWHLEIVFLGQNGLRYNLTPKEVMDQPELYKKEYERTLRADLAYPIDIMENKGRWLILDGLHRLMKICMMGEKSVRVRKVPREKIKDVLAD